jgi:N-methylhydantoinase A
LERSVDLRYVGQSFEINVPAGRDWRLVIGDFHARHEQHYGHAHPEAPVELVNLRVRAVGETPKPVFEELPAGGADVSAASAGERPVWFEAQGGLQPHAARLFERERFTAGNRIEGPAVVFQMDATTVVPPGWAGKVDRWGHLLLERR